MDPRTAGAGGQTATAHSIVLQRRRVGVVKSLDLAIATFSRAVAKNGIPANGASAFNSNFMSNIQTG